jgi:hypothetical protein
VPNRVTAVLLALFGIAVVSFVLALLSLRGGRDVTAMLLCILGGLSLRALHQAAKHAEGAR